MFFRQRSVAALHVVIDACSRFLLSCLFLVFIYAVYTHFIMAYALLTHTLLLLLLPNMFVAVSHP